jgi:hypothetical protein
VLLPAWLLEAVLTKTKTGVALAKAFENVMDLDVTNRHRSSLPQRHVKFPVGQ